MVKKVLFAVVGICFLLVGFVPISHAASKIDLINAIRAKIISKATRITLIGTVVGTIQGDPNMIVVNFPTKTKIRWLGNIQGQNKNVLVNANLTVRRKVAVAIQKGKKTIIVYRWQNVSPNDLQVGDRVIITANYDQSNGNIIASYIKAAPQGVSLGSGSGY